MEKSIISVKNVTKTFGDKNVVDDVSLEIKKGSIVGIIGQNGSGKTVLLKMIAGFYYPTKGNIIIDKQYNLNEDFGVLIDTGFMENESAYNNLKILSLLKNKISDKEIYDVLNYVKLDPFNRKKYKHFSSGMKQKLKIAQALMENPKILILDEPFNGLDNQSILYFRQKIKELNKSNITIIITSHYQEDIDTLCDKVYKMENGRLFSYEK